MQMSLWLRPYIKHYKKFGDAAFTLTRFFREKLPASDIKNESANMPMSEGSTKECLQESIMSTSGRQNLSASLQIMAEGGTTKNQQANIELVSESHHHDLMLQYNSEGMKDDDFQSSAPLDAMGIFGRKTVTPMFPHRESSLANSPYGSCKTLSSMLAAVRGKAKSSCIDVVSPANLSTCSIDDRPSRLESCGNHSKIVIPTLAKVQESEKLPIIDLSDSPVDNTYLEANRNHGLSMKRTKIFSSFDTNNIQDRAIKTQENMLNKTSDLSSANKRNYDEGPSAKTHMAHAKVNPETKLKSYSLVTSTRQETNKSLSSVEEEKSKTAAEFLAQVRAKLNDSEYRQFTDCMRGIKQKTVKMNNALQSVVRLLSSPERSFLLKRFRDFVPAQFHDLYEQYVNAIS